MIESELLNPMKTLDGYEIEIGMILYGTFAMPDVINPKSKGVKVMGFIDDGIRISTGYPTEDLGQHGLKAIDGVIQVYVNPPLHWIVYPYSDYTLSPRPKDQTVTGRSSLHQKCDIDSERIFTIPTYDTEKRKVIRTNDADYVAICEVCGVEYRTKRKHTRTCSPSCRKKLSRMGASKV